MGDDRVSGPPAKKRGATRQISKDDGSDSEGDSSVPLESRSFQKASEEVIASRRIVKVRRATPAPTAPAVPNPFASIRLVAPSGLLPASLAYVTPLAAAQVSPESVSGKDPVALASIDGVKNDEGQDGEASKQNVTSDTEVESTPEDKAQVSGLAEKEKRAENGSGDDVAPNPLQREGGGDESVDVSKEDGSGGGVDVKSEVNEPAQAAITTDKAFGVIAKDGDGQHDDGTANAQVKEPDSSVQIGESNDGNSTAVPSSYLTDKSVVKPPLPSLGAGIPGSFSFGTASTSFETPTAFASFGSTWSAFSSGTASGTSLGAGFAFNKAASDGGFASASSAFGNSNGSSFQLFSSQSTPLSTPLSMGPPAQPPASAIQFQGGNTQTGEEQEKMAFGGDATLFEFADASWKERGKGEVRVNVPIDKTGKARLLMRSKGNYRLILNASLYPDMKMTSMDSRGVTFACVNSAVEEKSGLVTYALKFKDSLAAANFRDSVDAHKSPSQGGLKTPESSPSALHGQ